MRIGIFAKTFPGTLAGDVLRQVAAAGYAGTQFNFACCGLPSMPDAIPPALLAEVDAAAKAAGVTIEALSGTYNMIHPDRTVRDAGMARLAPMLEAAAALGVNMVTLCTGTREPDDQWRHHPDNATPAAWDDLLAEMRRAAALAEAHGVDLGIEPERANVVCDAARAQRLIAAIGSRRIRIVLDPANLVEPDDALPWRETIAQAVALLGPWIGMAHAKDRGPDGGVAAVGEGAIDFPHFLDCLREAGFAGPLVTHGLQAAQAATVATRLHRLCDAR